MCLLMCVFGASSYNQAVAKETLTGRFRNASRKGATVFGLEYDAIFLNNSVRTDYIAKEHGIIL